MINKFIKYFTTFFIVVFVLFESQAYGAKQQKFEFSLADKVRVLSDKGYRKTRSNSFEAVGNVIITHSDKALYGEKASVSLETGDVEVIGNVRYVAPGMTVYGTKMFHNYKNRSLKVLNSRIVSDGYVILGKELSRLSDGVYVGKDAEYTTCRDCPESWAVMGKNVEVTAGEYIRITHAFIKVNGVVIMYVPYIVFPIKKNRETGLLFPKLSIGGSEGTVYKQPFFWAISPYSDMTLTPSFLGIRGLGNEFQYRKNIGENKWLEVNSLQIKDNIYNDLKYDDKESGDSYYRNLYFYEHRFDIGNNFNHHLEYSDSKDLDVIRDFSEFTDKHLKNSGLGLESFMEYRTSILNLGIDSSMKKNLLVDDARSFDKSYVQILPKISMFIPEIPLIQADYVFLKRISIGTNSDFTVFKQRNKFEKNYIRNAKRLNVDSFLNWDIGRLGPVRLKTGLISSSQFYKFSSEKDSRYAKHILLNESELSFSIEKNFGAAYKRVVKIDENLEDNRFVDKKKHNLVRHKDEQKLINNVPSIDSKYKDSKITVTKNSYKHTQEYKIKHFYTSTQKKYGNSQFEKQIANGNGQFDYIDAPVNNQTSVENTAFLKSLSKNNTIELQWNNSLIEKAPRSFDVFKDNRYLKDNFNYSRKAYFNASQGYNFFIDESALKDRLTRLYLSTGFTISDFSFSAYEYYFYNNSTNIFYFSLSKSFSLGSLSLNANYNGVSRPINKTLGLSGTFSPSSRISLSGSYNYDIQKKVSSKIVTNLLYSPLNKCWKLNINRTKTLIDTVISFDFLINFSDNTFTSLTSF